MPRAVPDPAFWSGRRVLVTGHTGFKGRWLTLWLEALGAEVSGFSRRDGGDVTDAAAVRAAVAAARPEVVFHLASLATVQLGYEDPAAVYAVNVVGTANVLQALREARRRPGGRSASRRTSATSTRARSGPTARTTGSAATTPTRAPRRRRSW